MDKRQKNQQKKVGNKSAAGSAPVAVNGKVSGKPNRKHQLSIQKRNELQSLVNNLLKIGVQPANNVNEQWEQYVKMQTILEKVQVLESSLKLKRNGISSRLANIDAFYKWSTENGIKYDGIKISEFPGFDLGLEATRDFKKGDTLITIPRKLILSEEHIPDDTPCNFSSMTNLKLAYIIMLEKLKNDSFWKPYLDMLPEDYNTVLYYSVSEMQELKGSNTLPQALKQCKTIARQYAFIYNCYQTPTRADQLSPIGMILKERFCYDLYRWAVSTAMTRENLIPKLSSEITDESKEKTIASLIPFWDMANHKDGVVTSFFDVGTNQLESSALSDFSAGEQIFIYYGDRSNADLMVHNGFINVNNAKDSVAIKLGLGASDLLCVERGNLLEKLNIPKSGELKVLPSPQFISPELLAFVRVFNMNPNQLDHWTQSDRATDLLHIDCALETCVESKTWTYLQTRLMLLLRVFPTTLEEDEAIWEKHALGQPRLNYVKSMILIYRMLEKKILLSALDYAKQRTKA